MSARIEPPAPELGRGDPALLLASLAGPLAWLAQLTVGFALTGEVCARQSEWPLHAVTAVALVAAVAGIAVCWRRRIVPAGHPPAGGPTRRAIAVAGIAVGLFFGILIVAYAIPLHVLEPCI